jgi:predicted 2-oxoglutarate/Fe(II)-dependent dioxygenase YbiX
MMLQIAGVLNPETVKDFHTRLTQEEAAFTSGKATAGWYATSWMKSKPHYSPTPYSFLQQDRSLS